MKLLLDTVAYIWFAENDANLSKLAADAIDNPANQLYLSSASVWEISIKYGLGRLSIQYPPEEFLLRQRRSRHIESLPIREPEALLAGTLPNIHRDPFDRIIIAQAIVENLVIVTPDSLIMQYQVPVLW